VTTTKAELLEYIDNVHELIEKELDFLIFSWHPDRRREPLTAHAVVVELTRVRDLVRGAA
jgi:hypothetical protein